MDHALDMGATPDRRKHKQDMTDAEFLRHVAHTAEVGDPVELRDVERLREVADLLTRFAGLRRVARLLDGPDTVQAISDDLRRLGVQFGYDASDCVRTGIAVLVQLEEKR